MRKKREREKGRGGGVWRRRGGLVMQRMEVVCVRVRQERVALCVWVSEIMTIN